jgi:hypothetical protein
MKTKNNMKTKINMKKHSRKLKNKKFKCRSKILRGGSGRSPESRRISTKIISKSSIPYYSLLIYLYKYRPQLIMQNGQKL